MNRRSFVQAGAFASIATPSLAFTQPTPEAASRDLVTHLVHDALRESSPMLVYAGLNFTPVSNETLLDIVDNDVSVSVWNDWNDDDLRDVFGAFMIGTSDEPMGMYRIFDTPDIAYDMLKSQIEEVEQGYVEVGGMRASRIVQADVVLASLRLWNVNIVGAHEDEALLPDVLLGMTKHLGTAIGAL